MFKGKRTVQVYLNRIVSTNILDSITKQKVLPQCRCLSFSRVLFNQNDDANSRRLKLEAPFFFKAIRRETQINKELKTVFEDQHYEKPLIFEPIRVRRQVVEDDLSHLGHYTPVSIHKEKVYVIQPKIKGVARDLTKVTPHRLAEAVALINCVQSWKVHTSCTELVKNPFSQLYFGTGKLVELSKMIRKAINKHGVTMVFVNTGKLQLAQIKELEGAFGCKVFDRYRVVLELFKERARTGEAKLQVMSAELRYLRSRLLKTDHAYNSLVRTEHKTKKALEEIKVQRKLRKEERIKKNVPHVAMVGYTNAGKTTLAKVLSMNSNLIAEDKLFATLDTTAHRGKLPSGLSLVYVDTVGFISDLPHQLVDAFSATLEDVKTADLLVHVTDCSHPEFELQCETVESVLRDLGIGEEMMEETIVVHNKIDLRNRIIEDNSKNVIAISATEGFGIQQLREVIEKKILQKTGRKNFIINLDLHGSELSWLYRNGTVVNTTPYDNGTLDVMVILDEASRMKYESKYQMKLK